MNGHFMAVILQVTNTLYLGLLGLVLVAAGFAWLAASRRRAAGSVQPPDILHQRQDPEWCDFNPKPVATEIFKINEHRSAVLTDNDRHILFVEDDRSIAEGGRIALKELGYQVTLVADANEALAVIRDAREKIHCVVTDLSMPGMSGFDLALLCQRLLPGVPVILMSNLEGSIAVELLQASGIHGRLSKPFTHQTLAQAVQRVLAGGKDLD